MSPEHMTTPQSTPTPAVEEYVTATLGEESIVTSSSDSEIPSSPEVPAYSPVGSISEESMDSSSVDDNDGENELQLHMHTTTVGLPTYKLVGDNLDKFIKPRHIRIDYQSRSLHYFHFFAVRDRVDVSSLDDEPVLPDLSKIDVTTVLPSLTDKSDIKKLFAFHIIRILKEYMPYIATYAQGCKSYVPHKYSVAMSKKSEVVSIS